MLVVLWEQQSEELWEVELVKEHIPDKLNDVKTAFNDFARECKLPFNV